MVQNSSKHAWCWEVYHNILFGGGKVTKIGSLLWQKSNHLFLTEDYTELFNNRSMNRSLSGTFLFF